MGRCYEFGVVIEEGCDHSMVVSPEGGACLCGDCGASCAGRFFGCGAILAMPGHVPIAAPKGLAGSRVTKAAGVPLLAALPSASVPSELAVPDVAGETAERIAPADDLPRMAEVIDMFEELLTRPERTTEALAQLRVELANRDGELVAAFDRLADAHDRVAAELAADREVRDRIVAVVAKLAERLDVLETAMGRPLLPGLWHSEG